MAKERINEYEKYKSKKLDLNNLNLKKLPKLSASLLELYCFNNKLTELSPKLYLINI